MVLAQYSFFAHAVLCMKDVLACYMPEDRIATGMNTSPKPSTFSPCVEGLHHVGTLTLLSCETLGGFQK